MSTKKARFVYNGSPQQKGAVILGKTFAAALDQSGQPEKPGCLAKQTIRQRRTNGQLILHH